MGEKKHSEIVRYVIFGAATTAVSWGSYTIFVAFGAGVPAANFLSWVLAVLFAFITNKIWVFCSKSWRLRTLVPEVFSFLSARILSGVLEIVGVPLLEKTGFDTLFYRLFESWQIRLPVLYTEGIYSKVVLSVFVVVLNYFLSKFVIFKKKQQ